MKKGYLEKFRNGVHLEEEEKEDLEIRGFRKQQQEWERRELTCNGSTETNWGDKTLGTERYANIDTQYIHK